MMESFVITVNDNIVGKVSTYMFAGVLFTPLDGVTAQKMKVSVKALFSKCDQIRSFPRIHIYWRNL